MGMRQSVKVWVALAIAVQVWVPGVATATAGLPSVSTVGLAACGEAVRVEAGTTRRSQPTVKVGTIPGLGAIRAAVDWDNRHELTLAGKEFQVTRSYTPLMRQSEITISGDGEVAVEIRLGGVDGFSITRGAQVLRGTSDPDAIRALMGGRAVGAFRELIGNYERRLMAGATTARLDDPHADGFLLAGAFVSSLAGDPTAVGRSRDL